MFCSGKRNENPSVFEKPSLQIAILISILGISFSLSSVRAGTQIPACVTAVTLPQEITHAEFHSALKELAKVIEGIRDLELSRSAQQQAPKLYTDVYKAAKKLGYTTEQFNQLLREEIKRFQDENKHLYQIIGKSRAKRDEERRLEEEARMRQEQEEWIENSSIDGTRAIMQRVEPGQFRMGEEGNQVEVEITKPFDLMATPMTQIIWKKVGELANSRFGDRYQINIHPPSFKGETKPIVEVSFNNIEKWISALNELSQAGEPSLIELISGHKNGDVYRLPTEAEWEFVVRGRGKYADRYNFGSKPIQLGDYCWHYGNAQREIQPVGRMKPLMIGAKKFYDMYGNVWEMVQDWYQSFLPGGTDPQGPKSGVGRVVRGGSCFDFDSEISSSFRESRAVADSSAYVGFRLARTVK